MGRGLGKIGIGTGGEMKTNCYWGLVGIVFLVFCIVENCLAGNSDVIGNTGNCLSVRIVVEPKPLIAEKLFRANCRGVTFA